LTALSLVGSISPQLMVRPEADDERTPLLHRAFGVLACFSVDEHELALVDLVERTGLPKATLHRLAGQLVSLGLLERVGRNYRLGVRLFELCGGVWAQRVLRDLAMPFLQDLYEETHETVQLAALDGDEVLYVDRIRGHSSVVLPTYPGGRMPAYCTGLGKAMLAFSSADAVRGIVARGMPRLSSRTVTPNVLLNQLREIRRTRIAYDAEEALPGICCVAAPILTADGMPLGAVSVSATTTRVRRLRVEAVRNCAARIGHAVGEFERES
jgi:DNA-binding IclR family transcriptional regulator